MSKKFSLPDIFEKLQDSKIACIALLPLAVYNTVSSYMSSKKKFKILVDTINSSDKFAACLGTLGFMPEQKLWSLVTTYETNMEITDEQIYTIANQQIILAVKNFLVDERLLNIVKISINKKPNFHIEVSLSSSDKDMFIYDISILAYSLIANALAVASYLYFIV